MAPLAHRRPEAVLAAVRELAAASKPQLASVNDLATGTAVLPAEASRGRGHLTLAASVTEALADALAGDRRVVVFGEDVADKGGVYGATRGLARRFGAGRVFDTLLDEQAILGLALGAGLAGLLPVPEIQYLAYLHNAEDQLRGEAATLPFFSQGAYRNPMVVRVAGLGYQKGFGGHFHNDNALAVLRDIPGLVVACPARGATPRRCSAPAWPLPPSMALSACSWSRSRCTTPATCTTTTMPAGWTLTCRLSGGRPSTSRLVGVAPMAVAVTSRSSASRTDCG